MKTVKVMFDHAYDTRTYSYKCHDDSVEKGDQVVVDTPNGDSEVVEVVDVIDGVSKTATKWIVCKVDRTEYAKRLAKEQRKREIKEILDDEKKKMDELLVYKMLAENNPAMEALLNELKELND